MARPLRIEYEGAVCHVMARGNRGQAIFADRLDRQAWAAALAEASEKTGWRIHAYVLRKGALEKQVLAWWLRQRTTVGRRWISERLGIGEESGRSKAVQHVKASRDKQLNRMKQWLWESSHAGGNNQEPP